nr:MULTISPECIES: ATP-binding protein [unclassified Methylobacterium]
MNDQFRGENRASEYVRLLNEASPEIHAIGVTDYYVLDTYEEICARRAELSRCALIFPNVELRLGLQTVKGRFINLHLLISPDGADHVASAKRFLEQLTFEAHGDTYRCRRDELIRLGRAADPSKVSELAALSHGALQFKVEFSQLRTAYGKSDWANTNVLIAVSGTETDGTSGMRNAADQTLREEMEHFADVIFASSGAQRDFWLARKTASEGELKQRYRGLKPCLHGCDAHALATVGLPDADRYSWIKGDVRFDALRQACIDPAGRTYVGSAAPVGSVGSEVIRRVEILNTDWAQTSVIELNPGLVTIIGARGSGKTALADMIAAGCDALPNRLSPASFMARAQNRNVRTGARSNLLGGAAVRIEWDDDDIVERPIDGTWVASSSDFPRARYLSQQFVEELCSSDGMTDELVGEIERVIFASHSLVDRDGAINFDDMRDEATARFAQARRRAEDAVANISEEINTELEKQRQLTDLQGHAKRRAIIIESLEADRKKLVTTGSEDRVQRLAELTAAADYARGQIRAWNARKSAVAILQDEVRHFQNVGALTALAQSKARHRAAALEETDWSAFLLEYAGDVDSTLTNRASAAQKSSDSWRGKAVSVVDLRTALIAPNADLSRESLAILDAEIGRIQAQINTDSTTAARYAAVSKKVDEERAALNQLNDRITDALQASTRAGELRNTRNETYREIFKSIVQEQETLRGLYAPLTERLSAASKTVAKLSFSVNRNVDLDSWAAKGEKLFDLRGGDFKGRGTLREYAEKALRSAWEEGDEQAVFGAISDFLSQHQRTLLDLANVPRADAANFRHWAKQFAKWLYGTSHITLTYSIDYDGIDIRHLSPGTRGIVLLLLYLALDDTDTRPLIIDQPEENLDPKSIYDELVQLFMTAKNMRQVIMVTHNANLVINTDADQIIVAKAGPHKRGHLPPITYNSGGLEELGIRTAVCGILEGGEIAFKERARRLRVALDR